MWSLQKHNLYFFCVSDVIIDWNFQENLEKVAPAVDWVELQGKESKVEREGSVYAHSPLKARHPVRSGKLSNGALD